jgi:hypothetical protein
LPWKWWSMTTDSMSSLCLKSEISQYQYCHLQK